jgi:hypothetical protein
MYGSSVSIEIEDDNEAEIETDVEEDVYVFEWMLTEKANQGWGFEENARCVGSEGKRVRNCIPRMTTMRAALNLQKSPDFHDIERSLHRLENRSDD